MKRSDLQSEAVIMCGISGSGKTHYARRLEKEGYVRLSTDALIWEKKGADLFGLPAEEQKRLFAECRAEILGRLAALLESGEKVVVDATHCRRAVRDEIRGICRRADVRPVFVYCQADEEELWRRLSRRKGEGPDDLPVSRGQLAEYLKGFERPQEDETDFIFSEDPDI